MFERRPAGTVSMRSISASNWTKIEFTMSSLLRKW
jgi:hypothetical protein